MCALTPNSTSSYGIKESETYLEESELESHAKGQKMKEKAVNGIPLFNTSIPKISVANLLRRLKYQHESMISQLFKLYSSIQNNYIVFSLIIFKQQVKYTVMDEARGFIRTIATAQDPSLVRCFRGHQKTVNAVDFSKDMKQVVSGGSDGLVQVWSFKPQIRPFKFVGHKGTVNDVLFNSQATRVYSCGQDRDIRIWKNTVNGKNKSVKAHSGSILKLCLSKEEDFLVSCSSDKTIKMWNPQGKFKQSFLGHTNWVRQCTISPDQRMLLSCSDDKTVKLWDIQKATVTVNFPEHKAAVLSCKFTPDGTCVAGAAADGTIKVWDTRLSKLIQHYNAHDSAINQICFHPLGCHMASVSNDNKIKIWNLKKGTLDWTLYGHTGEIKCLNFNEKGDYFATGGSDKLVMIWMSNFDKQMHQKGRRIQANFRQKSNGDGVQPLFKSNILNYGGSKQEQYGLKNQANGGFGSDPNGSSRGQVGTSKKSIRIAQLMSFQLQKMVNQLQFVTRSLDSMDRHMTQHEQIIQKLQNSETIDSVMNEMQGRKLLVPTIYNSAWQAQRQFAKQSQQLQRQIQMQDEQEQREEGSQGQVEEEVEERQFVDQIQKEIGDYQYQNNADDNEDQNDDFKRFIMEEERKKKIFQQQMQADQGLDFQELEMNKGYQ